MTSGELHILLPRGLKCALRSIVGFFDIYFELLQCIEIIYITNKCNQYVTCLSFILFVRFFTRNIQTAVFPHPPKIGHMFIWTYSLGTVHTYLLTPWCRVLLEKLTGLQLIKKFPAFHGTRRFITALTSVRHLSLSWASPIQSIYPHPTSWRSVLIYTTTS